MSLAGRDLTIGYSDRVVGRGLNVALERGEVLALLGPNGGGKTTLLKTLLGLIAPRAGEVAIGSRQLAAISVRERARLLAYVPQAHVPTFAFTVESVVLMGRTAHGNLFSRPSARDAVVAARTLERFGIAHLSQRRFVHARSPVIAQDAGEVAHEIHICFHTTIQWAHSVKWRSGDKYRVV